MAFRSSLLRPVMRSASMTASLLSSASSMVCSLPSTTPASIAMMARGFAAAAAPSTASAASSPPPPVAGSSSDASSTAPADSGAPVYQRKKVKFKNHFKRASSTLADINAEAILFNQRRIQDFRPPLPDFNVGDAIEITYALDHSEKKPTPVRGTVIAKRRNGLDSAFTILNAIDGEEWYTASYTLSSPLLRGVKIMRRNRHSDGEKRARRAKLTYLFGRDPKTYSVDHTTREASEILKEKLERREAQKAGKVYRRPGQEDKPKPAAKKGGAAKDAKKK